jgi:hypothetical protein
MDRGVLHVMMPAASRMTVRTAASRRRCQERAVQMLGPCLYGADRYDMRLRLPATRADRNLHRAGRSCVDVGDMLAHGWPCSASSRGIAPSCSSADHARMI